MDIELPPLNKLVNKRFEELWHNKDRYLVLWGGRGSSKSYFTAQKLIYRCLTEDFFRFVLIRKVADTVKDSQYQTIKDEIERWGIGHLFKFTVNPLEIVCKNGNKFLCRGLDKPDKLKSLKDPTGAWYEEGNQMTEEDFITVTTSIRSKLAPYLQEIFSFNPEYPDADFKDFWIYKRFFADHGEEKSFRSKIELDDPRRPGAKIRFHYTCHHSTYHDNRFITPEFVATLEELKKSNYYYYLVFCLGLWGKKQTGGEFYKDFDLDSHVGNCVYNKDYPLHITFDENVNPYMTLLIWQVKGKSLQQIDEICLPNPNNNVGDICAEFRKRYRLHNAGLFMYGDATSRKKDAKLERGYDFYKLCMQYLSTYRPRLRVPGRNPSIVMRGSFINSVFKEGFGGAHILIDNGCKNTINDYINLKEAPDGTKHKARVRDKQTGVSYQQYGHCTDANDYFICEVFKDLFTLYQRGNRGFAAVVQKFTSQRY
ncbi:MAG: PBSX family phage terminase large subunit [Nitrosomonadaceae bacterium]